MAYRSPAEVARVFAALGGTGPVLDVGAGTGLVGQALAEAGIGPVDGLDISAEMLARAAEKQVYRSTITADLTQVLPLPDSAYSGCISAGTFTTGHVGPEAFGELLRVTRPGAVFAVTVHSAFYKAAGFLQPGSRRSATGSPSSGPRRSTSTAPGADGDHSGDQGWIVSFLKA